MFCAENRVAFRRQLLWGPHAQVVRRRADLRQREIFHLETMYYIWGDRSGGERLAYLKGFDA